MKYFHILSIVTLLFCSASASAGGDLSAFADAATRVGNQMEEDAKRDPIKAFILWVAETFGPNIPGGDGGGGDHEGGDGEGDGDGDGDGDGGEGGEEGSDMRNPDDVLAYFIEDLGFSQRYGSWLSAYGAGDVVYSNDAIEVRLQSRQYDAA